MAKIHISKEKELLAANEQVIYSFISWLAGIYKCKVTITLEPWLRYFHLLAGIYKCKVTITRDYKDGNFSSNSVDYRYSNEA